jgi:hypothetical protein
MTALLIRGAILLLGLTLLLPMGVVALPVLRLVGALVLCLRRALRRGLRSRP